MKWIIVIGILIFMVLPSKGQYYVIKTERLGTGEGLSHNTTRCVVEDLYHNLWIGTDGGLNRYNGFQVTEFNTTNSPLRSDVIRTLNMLTDDRILIQTAEEDRFNNAEGMYIFDPDQGMVRLPGFNSGPSAQGLDQRQFFQDAFFTLDSNRLWKYSIIPDRWTQQDLPKGFIGAYILDGFLIGTIGNNRAIVQVNESSRFLTDHDIWAIDSTFATLYSSYDAIVNLAGTNGFLRSFFDPFRKLIWIGSGSSLSALDIHGNPVSLNQQLSFRNLESIQFGHEGLMLLPTNDGFFLARVAPGFFTIYPLHFPDSVPMESISQSARGLCIVDHKLYMNIDQYLMRQDLQDKDNQEILYSSNISKLFAMHCNANTIWIGRKQLVKIVPANNHSENIVIELPKFIGGLWSFFRNGNRCYLGGHGGVWVADCAALEKGEIEGLCVPLDINRFQIVYQISQTSQGIMFVTSKGLFRASPDDCDPEQISFEFPNGKNSISHFTHLNEDEDHSFWMTSQDDGIIHFILRDSIATVMDVLNREDGLSTNTAYAVYPDRYGSVWITTDDGLIQLRKQNWSYTVYTKEDGLAGNEFNRVSHTNDEYGNLYFGGVDGVVSFNPGDFYKNPDTDMPIRLLRTTQFVAWDDTILDVTHEVVEKGRAILHPNDKFIRFEFGLDDLFRTGEHRYEYRVADVYSEWQPMPGNMLSFNQLPYGRHSLEVRGRNAEGKLSSRDFQLQIIARGPVYMQWWFLMIVIAGIVIGIREYWVNKTRRARERADDLEAVVRQRTATISEQADALLELQQTRSRFFANISHELRTPLTLIRGPVQSLLDRSGRKENDRAYLELIRQNAVSLGERIDDLLLLSRLDAHQLKVQNENFNLNSFLERILDVFRSLAMEKNLKLEMEKKIDVSMTIRTDRKKLEHILSNYISNAIKFTPPSGRIIIRSKAHEGDLFISVQDDGPGIEPDDAVKVFDRFFQVIKTDRANAGTGIGLAICKELSEALGGSVSLESEPGTGSTFFVQIPLVSVRSDVGEAVTSSNESLVSLEPVISTGENAASGKLLIVEDNPGLRDFLRNELGLYQILTAGNGQNALNMLESLHQDAGLPDCIISDVMMPEMDGFEFVERIKKDDRLNAIPVIMLTARAGLEDKLTGLRIGVDDYIGKPFEIRELKARISNIINRKAAKTEVELEEDVPNGVDLQWLRSLEQQVLANISQTNYTLDQLADQIYISRRQMYRRIKKHTGLTANEYVREVRLCEARKLCEERAVATVAELSYAVGFEDPDYFSRLYAKRFGYRPSERL